MIKMTKVNESIMVRYEDDKTRITKSLGCIGTNDLKKDFRGTVGKLAKELPIDWEVIAKFNKAIDDLKNELKIYR